MSKHKGCIAGAAILCMVLGGCGQKMTAQDVFANMNTAEAPSNTRMSVIVGNSDEAGRLAINAIHAVSDNYVEFDSGIGILGNPIEYIRRYEVGEDTYKEYQGVWVKNPKNDDFVKDLFDAVLNNAALKDYFIANSTLEIDTANVDGTECYVIDTNISGDDNTFMAALEGSDIYDYAACLNGTLKSYVVKETSKFLYCRADLTEKAPDALKGVLPEKYSEIPVQNGIVLEIAWDNDTYEQAKAPDEAIANAKEYADYYEEVIKPEEEKEAAKETPEFVYELKDDGDGKILAGYYQKDGTYSAYEPASYMQSWTKKDENGNELAWYDSQTNVYKDADGEKVNYYVGWTKAGETVSEGEEELIPILGDGIRDVSHMEDIYSHTTCEICEYLAPLGKTEYEITQISKAPEDSDLAKVTLEYFNKKTFQTLIKDIGKFKELDELHKYAIISIIERYDFYYAKGNGNVMLNMKDTLFLSGVTQEEYNEIYGAYRQYLRDVNRPEV